jgi:galactokinase
VHDPGSPSGRVYPKLSLLHKSGETSAYNERQKVCEGAAHTLGLRELRDAHLEDLEKLSGEERKRAHHVITENSRVLENVQALQVKILECLL